MFTNFSKVGKTNILYRYVEDKFLPNYKPTIGADFLTKNLIKNEKQITLQVNIQ